QRITLDAQFPNQLSFEQHQDLEISVTYDEIKCAIWDCGSNKSPRPDGFTFDFYRRYWKLIDQDVVNVVSEFFSSGLYKGIQFDESLTLSHLFYADDAVFIVKWDKSNINVIISVLNCFFLASGVSSSRSCSWEDVLSKITARLSKWKLKTFSIGGRLTLLKSVLTSLPLYQMSVYKVPMGVLNRMESMRRNFFNGVDNYDRKLTMIGWKKILASKKKGGFSFVCGLALLVQRPPSL
nr:RNA-directed DNA polymerase, eukaryota [Tanacetum cinerariifolium]